MPSEGAKPGESVFDRVVLDHYSVRIGDIISRCFPRGTSLEMIDERVNGHHALKLHSGRPSKPTDFQQACKRAPALPTDLFAVCGVLLNLSGAVHHVSRKPTSELALSGPLKRTTYIEPDEIAHLVQKVAERWRQMRAPREQDGDEVDADANGAALPIEADTDAGTGGQRILAPFRVQQIWTKLLEFWDEPVFKLLHQDDPAPVWWGLVLKLLIVADEAGKGIGFYSSTPTPLWKIFAAYLTQEEAPDQTRRSPAAAEQIDATAGPSGKYTLCTISPDIVCVLPKSRTAQVGCTLRSLSHHLALLPPRGLARAHWIQPPQQIFPLREDCDPLNILLVPLPYELPPGSIEALEAHEADPKRRWGWFGIKKMWGPGTPDRENTDAIVDHIVDLAKESAAKVGSVNAIVLPEIAITFETFAALIKRVREHIEPHQPLHDVEIIVAGLRTDSTRKPGNYAGACIISRVTSLDGGPEFRNFVMAVQPKHHRWKLDRRQLDNYGFGPSLSSAMEWWEGIPLLTRSVSILAFRAGATLVPLICEDLARLEPVHDIVRSIGPTLVIALLLDGPQVPARWPGRYAMGLADDPGSSVLTVTSFGAVERAGRNCRVDEASRSVGLFRDDHGETYQLELDPGASGVVLTLSCDRALEYTLDGRSDDMGARRWIYSGHTSIAVEPTRENDWIKNTARDISRRNAT